MAPTARMPMRAIAPRIPSLTSARRMAGPLGSSATPRSGWARTTSTTCWAARLWSSMDMLPARRTTTNA